jgi:hypothetical protein
MPFSRAQLVKEAHGAGYGPLTERLVTDWVTIGLLGAPTRVTRGRGKGSGALYLWSDNQRALFLSLLAQRPGGNDIRRLLCLPVAVWLHWGDKWDVGLPQVRRALTSWADGAEKHYSTEDAALRNARRAVESLAAPDSTQKARRDLREAIVEMLRARSWDPERVAPLARAVLDPTNAGGGYGPFANSVDNIIEFLGYELRGLDELEHAPDGWLLEARAREQQGMAWYVRDWARLSQDPVSGSAFEEPTLDFVVSNSCRNIVRNLGAMAIAREAGRTLPPVDLTPSTRPAFTRLENPPPT